MVSRPPKLRARGDRNIRVKARSAPYQVRLVRTEQMRNSVASVDTVSGVSTNSFESRLRLLYRSVPNECMSHGTR